MNVEQIDLFSQVDFKSAPTESVVVLNGFYYGERTRQFVSFVQGKRHFEILASQCKGPKWPKDWQERIMRERVI
jgi:hypothetical protein